MIICSLLALQFCLAFLSLRKHAPLASHFVNFFSVACIVALLMTFFIPYSIMINVALGSSFISCCTIIIAGIWSFNNGYKTARFFLLAWACLLIGVMVQSLVVTHAIPDNVLTGNASAIGFCFEVLLLSLALGDRINQNKLERQHLALTTQQQMQKTHEELKETLEKEAQNNRLKDQFLATISHELRTPMNGVEGALALINTKKIDKQCLNFIEAAKLCAKEMTEMIEEILRFSEIQSGQLIIKPRSFELRSEFNLYAMKFRQQCYNKGLDFHWHIDKQLPTYIFADQEQLLLILNQLTSNAIKFTNTGYVTVNLWQGSYQGTPELVISVSDTGEGIPADQLDTIFNDFYQVDGRHNRRHNGLGIGLAICKQLSAIMNSRLTVESTIGKGTSVNFHTPLAASSEKSQSSSTKKLNSAKKKNVVLVAEDNPINQMILRNMLDQLGCIVLTADNGQEAIQILKQQPVDLIMMDCQMPIVDGFEATRMIRNSKAIYSDIPIVAVTANAMTGDSTRCIVAGMNDYIKKPINRDVLESKTARWLNLDSLVQ